MFLSPELGKVQWTRFVPLYHLLGTWQILGDILGLIALDYIGLWSHKPSVWLGTT